MDSSEIGRFGTLRLMKGDEFSAATASFPIDDEELTIGRDPSCALRLYYDTVSALHAKIIFQERKAFLVVLGSNGLLLDNCSVFPTVHPSGQSGPTTVHLPNESTIEIAKKRFVFTYPPKELRAALIASPRGAPGRVLRMSMIASAEVFSPRPSADPMTNLKILRSPLKRRMSSPLKKESDVLQERSDGNDYEEEIVLVDGNHPHVVESEKDLVILEDVPFSPAFPSTLRWQNDYASTGSGNSSNSAGLLPRTPVRPRGGGGATALHRAVLIRSAQRAVLAREVEEEEEREVIGVVAAVDDEHEEQEEDDIEGIQGYDDGNDFDEESENGDDVETNSEYEKVKEAANNPWRRSWEAVADLVGLRSTASPSHALSAAQNDAQHEVSLMAEDDDGDDDDLQLGDEQEYGHVPSTPSKVRQGIPGQSMFMTPQPRHALGSAGRHAEVTGRYSVGGGAKRVMIEPVWKVRDIVVDAGSGEPQFYVKKEDEAGAPDPFFQRPKITAEERRDIQARRRSALLVPDTTVFFKGATPGIGPRANTQSEGPSSRVSLSPKKGKSGGTAAPSKELGPTRKEDSDEGDTKAMLQRMTATVEDMKRRSERWRVSLGAGRASSSPAREPASLNVHEENVVSDEPHDVETGEEETKATFPMAHAVPHVGSANERIFQTIPRTPKMDGVRELFHMPIAPKTPRMDGIRQLYQLPPTLQTPRLDGLRELYPKSNGRQSLDASVLEGIGEMMKTPPAWKTAPQTEEEAGETPFADESTARVPHARGNDRQLVTRKTPAIRTTARRVAATITPSDMSGLADDEATPADSTNQPQAEKDNESAATKPATGRLLRGRRVGTLAKAVIETEILGTRPQKNRGPATELLAESHANDNVMDTQPKRRGRKAASVEPANCEIPEDAKEMEPVKRRGRKPATTSEYETSNSEASSKSRRQFRDATVVLEKEKPNRKHANAGDDEKRSHSGLLEVVEGVDESKLQRTESKADLAEGKKPDSRPGARTRRTLGTTKAKESAPASRTRLLKQQQVAVDTSSEDANDKENSHTAETDEIPKAKPKGRVGRPRKVKEEEPVSEPIQERAPVRITRTRGKK